MLKMDMHQNNVNTTLTNIMELVETTLITKLSIKDLKVNIVDLINK
jgi:hypothetical protein